MNLPDGFGHWFAGFVDGEGSFVLNPPRKRAHGQDKVRRPTLVINQRDDDVAVLKMIQETLGVGTIYLIERERKAHWTVFRLQECLLLVRLFEVYPLRAKKRRDLAVWRQVVLELQRPAPERDFEQLERLYLELFAVRRYDPNHPERVEYVRPPSLQTRFDLDDDESE